MKQSIIACTLLASAFGAVLAIADRNVEDLGPKLSIDKSPPERSGIHSGYADIVEKVAPSVVGVLTSRKAASADVDAPDGERFYDSPLFRDFFGRRFEDGGARRQLPQDRPREQGLGSGVILTADGYILTNNHVVDSADEIQVRLSSGEEFDAVIVASDPASDVAVIKVDAEDLPAVTIGDSENLKPGDFVLAIGSPFGLNHTVTQGIVSALGRNDLNITGYEDFIQTDASINPGNSGGALIDNKGRVVGINTAIFSRSGGNVGIGFAIPVNMAVQIADELIHHGEIHRGYLGVTLGPLTNDLAEALEVEGDGVVVNEVMPGTPAEKAGFEAGDVIVACNGDAIENAGELRLKVAGNKPGSELAFKVRRGAKELVLTAEIAEMPKDLLASAGPENSAPGHVAAEGALKGVRLGELTAEIRGRLELEEDTQGVVVLEVDPDSKAAMAGLRAGNVITEVNRASVTSPKEAFAKAGEREDKATLLRVTDGRMHRFMAIS